MLLVSSSRQRCSTTASGEREIRRTCALLGVLDYALQNEWCHMKKSPTDHAKLAADALAKLHVMGCVEDMLSISVVGSADAAAMKIIAIARKEQARQLRIYDQAIAKIGKAMKCK